MITDPTPHMMRIAAEYAEFHAHKGQAEACGVFFYPDRLMARGDEWPCTAKFIKIANRATNPSMMFEFDYESMERAIRWAYVGVPSGFVQVFHSHLEDLPPSPEDFALVEALDTGLRNHPIWHPTLQHKLYTIPSKRWIDFSATVAEDTFSAATNQGRTVG